MAIYDWLEYVYVTSLLVQWNAVHKHNSLHKLDNTTFLNAYTDLCPVTSVDPKLTDHHCCWVGDRISAGCKQHYPSKPFLRHHQDVVDRVQQNQVCQRSALVTLNTAMACSNGVSAFHPENNNKIGEKSYRKVLSRKKYWNATCTYLVDSECMYSIMIA